MNYPNVYSEELSGKEDSSTILKKLIHMNQVYAEALQQPRSQMNMLQGQLNDLTEQPRLIRRPSGGMSGTTILVIILVIVVICLVIAVICLVYYYCLYEEWKDNDIPSCTTRREGSKTESKCKNLGCYVGSLYGIGTCETDHCFDCGSADGSPKCPAGCRKVGTNCVAQEYTVDDEPCITKCEVDSDKSYKHPTCEYETDKCKACTKLAATEPNNAIKPPKGIDEVCTSTSANKCPEGYGKGYRFSSVKLAACTADKLDSESPTATSTALALNAIYFDNNQGTCYICCDGTKTSVTKAEIDSDCIITEFYPVVDHPV
jgi:hypothetical protein